MSNRERIRGVNEAVHPALQRPLRNTYLPAMAPVEWLEALRTRLGQWLRTWRRRQQFRRLLALEDHLLVDLGYTRAELRWGTRLPMHVDAARAVMARRRAQRRGS